MQQRYIIIFFINILLLTCFMPQGPQRRDHNALQLPCGQLNCQRHFKTAAGRTKHRLSAHPIFPAPTVSATRPDTPSLHNSPSPSHSGHIQRPYSPPNDNGDQFDAPRPSSPPDVEAEFFGPGNRLYRNYHKDLDGK
jgi:hypothetical protein